MDKKTTKGPGSQISALAIRSGIDQKLHCLVRPVHSGLSALAEKPRDAEAKVRGQRPADVEAEGPRLADAEAGSLRWRGQRGQIRSLH